MLLNKFLVNYLFNNYFFNLVLIDYKGNMIKCEVFGNIECKCNLSGMPDCKLGLNDKALYELEKNKNL